jgi:hypothetical protein
MVKKVNLVNFSETLQVAEKIGYSWNEAHKILVSDEICPMYECNSRNYCISDFDYQKNQYGYSQDTLKIMNAFFNEHDLEELTMVND